MTLRTTASDLAGTALVMLVSSAFAIGVGYVLSDASDETSSMRKNRRIYTLLHNCTVVSMERRKPSRYRCDLPRKAYLSVKELSKKSEEFAGKDAAGT